MSSVLLLLLIMEEERLEKLKRRVLRDHNNPLELPEPVFVAHYRLNKEAFVMVLNTIERYIPPTSISSILKLCAVPRFLAEGSYQRSVGNDMNISLGRSIVSETLTQI
ncbi:uncharacterized protein LOC118732320 [Rhagoletis pomonella]|uniref:uncharacterized protein LOC118732320 n=1 Tax=Rhagoletis pomonella TaxID=28610 RepID=UPI0017849F81|nr:uncharacterized protein LOC118732320 [Rhagoletis pomonella]